MLVCSRCELVTHTFHHCAQAHRRFHTRAIAQIVRLVSKTVLLVILSPVLLIVLVVAFAINWLIASFYRKANRSVARLLSACHARLLLLISQWPVLIPCHRTDISRSPLYAHFTGVAQTAPS